MRDDARTLDEEAREFRESGEFAEAGDAFTRAAYEYAGDATRSFPEPSCHDLAVRSLLNATTCYRIDGDAFRVQNRCKLRKLFIEDHVEYVEEVGYETGSFADLRRGAWPEFIGDLRAVAERADADEAYDEARSIYESAGADVEFVAAEQEHMALAAFFWDVRSGAGHDIPDDAPEQLGFGTTFPEWLAYKRGRLPGLLEELEEQGEWPVER